ncbi:MAG: hypothetical protein QXS54_03090 [Candidatus Methanomethylicaceae archaeon]
MPWLEIPKRSGGVRKVFAPSPGKAKQNMHAGLDLAAVSYALAKYPVCVGPYRLIYAYLPETSATEFARDAFDAFVLAQQRRRVNWNNDQDPFVLIEIDVVDCFNSISAATATAGIFMAVNEVDFEIKQVLWATNLLHKKYASIIKRAGTVRSMLLNALASFIRPLTVPDPEHPGRRITAQGLPSSPIVANVALHGLVDMPIMNAIRREYIYHYDIAHSVLRPGCWTSHVTPRFLNGLKQRGELGRAALDVIKDYSDMLCVTIKTTPPTADGDPGLRYFRYSDNCLVIATLRVVPKIEEALAKIQDIAGLRFRTRVFYPGEAVTICGWRNELGRPASEMRPPRGRRRRLRALKHIISKYADNRSAQGQLAGLNGWLKQKESPNGKNKAGGVFSTYIKHLMYFDND